MMLSATGGADASGPVGPLSLKGLLIVSTNTELTFIYVFVMKR
jgi:hypothetical protein